MTKLVEEDNDGDQEQERRDAVQRPVEKPVYSIQHELSLFAIFNSQRDDKCGWRDRGHARRPLARLPVYPPQHWHADCQRARTRRLAGYPEIQFDDSETRRPRSRWPRSIWSEP